MNSKYLHVNSSGWKAQRALLWGRGCFSLLHYAFFQCVWMLFIFLIPLPHLSKPYNLQKLQLHLIHLFVSYESHLSV